MNLDYDMTGALMAGEKRPPAIVMRELGIRYEDSLMQSLFDAVWYYNCTNIPENLPDYISELKVSLNRFKRFEDAK